MIHILEKLEIDNIITFRPKGNSMNPKIKNGQEVTIKKLKEEDKVLLKKNDIVFCKVKNNLYLHLISAIKGDLYQISNNSGYVNGWISKNNIYAILIKK